MAGCEESRGACHAGLSIAWKGFVLCAGERVRAGDATDERYYTHGLPRGRTVAI